MVVRLDITKAFLPKLNEVLEENMSLAAMRAIRECCELMGVVPKWDQFDENFAVVIRDVVRAVYLEIAVAGGAVKVTGQAKKKG